MKITGQPMIWALLFGTTAQLSAEAPQWWTDRNVLRTNSAAHDYHPVNQGQVKWMCMQAAAEFVEKLPGLGNTNILKQIDTLPSGNNFRPANLGMLKAVALPFYERLIEEGYALDFPWAASTNPPRDFALANQGQLKNLFSFDLDAFDSDGDGLPDWREKLDGLNPNNPDSDGDGYSDYDELLVYRTNPGNGDVLPPTVSIVTPVSSIIFVP